MVQWKYGDEAPALDLSGLLGITKWVKALNSFDKDGDYGVFADLLEADGLATTQTKPLKDAAFFERIFNVPQAADELKTFRQQTPKKLPGIGNLFSKKLDEYTSWHINTELYEHQRDLAYSFLDKGDYSRAAIFAVEGFITSLMHGYSDKKIRDYYQRNNAEKRFLNKKVSSDYIIKLLNNLKKEASDHQEAISALYVAIEGVKEFFQLTKKSTEECEYNDKQLALESLKKLRNMMAHSNSPKGDVKIIMENPTSLKVELEKLMQILFDDNSK